MNRVVVSGAAESPQIETKRRPDMTQTALFPTTLNLDRTPRNGQRSASHQCPTYGRNHDGIRQVQTQKMSWSRKTALIPAHGVPPRAGGAVITDELKQRHIERVTRRELARM
jgi:hypothetical protein